jgi:hypothetical protein
VPAAGRVAGDMSGAFAATGNCRMTGTLDKTC